MALSDIVNVSVTRESANVLRAGFGVPCILAADAPAGFTERTRTYTDLAGLSSDGFNLSGATYLQAAAVFAQNPRPEKILVGRLIAGIPTQRFAVTPVVGNLVKYQLRVNGNLVEYTSDASATAAEIIAGLKTAIDALGLGVTTSDQTTYLRILANAAGAFFSVESLDVSKLGVTQDHSDGGGLATDLAAIALEDNSFYALLFGFNSKLCVDAISDYAEANKKLFIAATQDSDVIRLSNAADTGGSQTVAGLLKADNKFRTALIYHPNNGAFADGALAGRCLPLTPGSETWAFKTLAGVATVGLTATQRTNALAKNVNIYELVAGVGVTNDGKVSANEYIDVIRFIDWLQARIGEEVFGALARSAKIPFTDAGASVIQGLVAGVLQQGIAAGGLSNDPAPKVTVPKVANVSAIDKAARTLPDVKFDAVLAGAIQIVKIAGNVSV